MNNVLIICPVHSGTPTTIYVEQCRRLEEVLRHCNASIERESVFSLMIDDWEPDWMTPPTNHVERATRIAAVRNHCINGAAQQTGSSAVLNDLSHVIWLDVDVLQYPNDLFSRLVDVSVRENAIVAPMIFLSPSRDDKPAPSLKRWYDTAGFIHNGERTNLWRPWFHGAPNDRPLPSLFEMNGSVGCVYCVPWKVYQAGGCHYFCGERLTEHFPVCQHAISMGLRCLVDTTLEVYHAHLPDYGVDFH